MARGKKSFLLYCDIIHTIKKLTDEQAGKLFKHILSYVNDENPITDDIIIDLTFEPIKQQLKRDLREYETICRRNRANGSLGGRPKENPNEPKKPSGLIENPENPVGADNDIDKDIDIEKKKRKIKIFKPPTIEEVKQYFIENEYSEAAAEKAYYHYALADWYDAHGNKVLNWKSKMHTNWFKPEYSTVKKLAI